MTEQTATTPTVITGRVVSLDGQPVSGASIVTAIGSASSDDNGWFEAIAESPPQWVTVDHPDFFSRTRAAAPGTPVLFRLTPDDGETISIHFAGDTMFGRRFYDPNEDGDTSDGLLPIDASVSEHLALLRPVQPLLENADLTVVNLESPLSEDPYFGPTDPRPAAFHQSKDYVFASYLNAAQALREAGVDVVDIGNNHVYDLLEQGLLDTMQTLAQVDLAYFGAGQTEQDAWRPAIVTLRGQTVAFIGCTTVTHPYSSRSDDDVYYVASDTEQKGGAAACTEEGIRQAVSGARAQYDIVILMIHGGYEYDPTPSEYVARMTTVARDSGATLVVNHHSHVVGGFDWDGSSLVVQSMGNFIFDQTVWPTLEGYLLDVHIRQGEVIRVSAEPLIIEGYVPKGLTGNTADFVARGAAGRVSGPFLVENGAMESDFSGIATRHDTILSIEGGPEPGTIIPIPSGQWVSGFSGDGNIRLGRDLLWVGSFEDEDVDNDYLEGALWDLSGPDKYIGENFAYEGGAGVRLERGARNQSDVVLSPLHRALVQPETQLSAVGVVRTSEGGQVTLQLSWYPDTRGPSSQQTIEPIDVQSSGVWEPFRLDVTVPSDAVAVGLFLRLSPPLTGLATADLDNIRLIEWAAPGAPFASLYDHISVTGTGNATLSQDILPGAEAWRVP